MLIIFETHGNMKLLFNIFLVSFGLVSIASGLESTIIQEENKQSFVELLHDAYIVKYKGKDFIAGFYYDRKTCVYGATPNKISKNRIDKIYKLMSREFDTLHPPIYVKNLKDCPNSSNLFIFLHENWLNKEAKLEERHKVESFLGLNKSKNTKNASGLASVYRTLGNNSFIIIEINQLTKYLDNYLYGALLRSAITEELMQAISGGNDLNIKTLRMSILQEPHLTQLPYSDSYLQKRIGSKWHIDFYRKMLRAKPSGFCSFDLWFLELARLAHRKNYILY